MDEACQKICDELCPLLGIAPDSSSAAVRKALCTRVEEAALSGADGAPEEIERLCALYFDFCAAWHKYLAGGGSGGNDHPDAAKLKTEGGALTRNYQKVIVGYACCRWQIANVARQLEADIEKAAQNASPEHKDIPWTYDLPAQVALMTRKREVLSDYMTRIRQARPVVDRLEPAFAAFETNCHALLGKGGAKMQMDEFTGLLRKHRFGEARRAVHRLSKKDRRFPFWPGRRERREKWEQVETLAAAVIDCVEKTTLRLEGRGGRMFLRDWEVRLAYETMERELAQAISFLEKYTVPEIRYRRDALDREGERLAALSSFEKLLDLLDDLLKGRFNAMKTLKDVKDFEAGPLLRVRHALDTVAGDTAKIEKKVLSLASGPDPASAPDDGTLLAALDASCAGAAPPSVRAS